MTVTSMDASSVNARISALEQAVGALRAEYNRMLPAFSSLNTTNERIQGLLDDVEAENERVSASMPAAHMAPTLAAPPVSSYKAPMPEDDAVLKPGSVIRAETMQATAPVTKVPVKIVPPVIAPVAVATSPSVAVIQGKPSSSITGLRIGEHGTKTRLVFDVTAKTKPEFKYDIDNAEKLLLVDMPVSVWTSAPSGSPTSPLVSSWNAQITSSGGSVIAIQLKKNVRVLATEFIKPEGKIAGRLVMDIAAE